MTTYLDFEKPIAELEGELKELNHRSESSGASVADERARIQARIERHLAQIYGKLSAWQKTQVARHPERPHFSDYIAALIADFTPLAGDRAYGDDHAIIGGLGRLHGRAILVLGHEKGADTEDRVRHNFGMARPEGYRKAIRLMRLAERFALPVVTFIDTPGAYPGVGAEERGQAEAIARSIETCLDLRVPIVSAVIGEGGSGGAIALGVANRIMMLEHTIYSVISPEGCASILWRSAVHAQDAAEALKLTAQDLYKLGIVDRVIDEPVGGAHRARETTIAQLGAAIGEALAELAPNSGDELRRARRKKFSEMGRAGLE
jgi:acetyl-CoA carboxylase carboxyl transferase subunit alpha